jgi:CRP-like cAMP-binding protein
MYCHGLASWPAHSYSSGVMSNAIQDKVAQFFADYPTRTYDKRQVMVWAKEQPADVFYIVEGRVSQYDIAPNGNEVVVNVFRPGAFFPMSSAINSTPNAYFFEADVATTVRQAPARAAVEFLQNNPDVMFDLLARVYRGTDGVLRRMAHLMGGGAHSRLVFELLNATHRFGESQPDGSVRIPLTETDLARHSGLARETVSRHLQRLKTAGVVTIAPERITVSSVHRLEELLGTAL